MAVTFADKLNYLKANADSIANLIPGGMAVNREAATGSVISLSILTYGGSPMTPDQAVASGILSGYLPQ